MEHPTDSKKSDAKIVNQIIAGDSDAYAILIARYESKLQRYVTFLIHDSSLALDVVQDTFIKAYQNLQGFNSNYKFSSWIYRIAHNEAMNAVRKNGRTRSLDNDEAPEPYYEPRLDEKIDQEILNQYVHGCIEKLEPKYREVVQLVYFEHMKYDEVSDVLHVPSSTVGVWLSRAKAKLKTICEQKGAQQ